jgi:hypothetical protein
MGSTQFGQKFNHYDWRLGVRALQEEANKVYGHQDGYSGKINSCDEFSLHTPRVKFANDKEVWKYVRTRLPNIEKSTGEVIDLGITGHAITKPVIEDYGGIVFNPAKLQVTNKQAIMLNKSGFMVSNGTLEEMKEQGKRRVMHEKFELDYYIISKNSAKVYVVTGKTKYVKSTSKRSDDNQLVRSLHDFFVYGWAGM